VLDPIAFCNPTRKIHNEVATAVQNANAHLTCYTITPSPFEGATGPHPEIAWSSPPGAGTVLSWPPL